MATSINIELGYKDAAWFAANPTKVLLAGQIVYLQQTGTYKIGDGTTTLTALSFLGGSSASTPNIQQVLTAGSTATTTITTTGFIKTAGTSAEFLKADGSVDSSTYLTTLGTAATSLTTTGTSGASTLIANVLNVPNYTLAGLGGTTLAAVNAQNLSVFAATTSLQLAGVISDETGSGALVFGTSPIFTTDITTPLINGVSGVINFSNTPTATGALITYNFTTAAHTNQTLSTNIPNFKITGSTKQWATGTVPLQYFNYFTSNTVSFVGASTATNVYGLYVEAATAGTNATITNNYAAGFNGRINILSDTATIMIGSQVGSTARGAIYINQATPDTTNFSLSAHQTTGNTYLNGQSGVQILVNGGILHTFDINTVIFAPTLKNGGSNTPFTFTCGADLNQVASTNAPYFKITGSTKTFLLGTLTTQYFNYFSSNTLAFTGASTATNVYNLFVETPIQGTNATITNNFAAGFGGSIDVDGLVVESRTAAANISITTGDSSIVVRRFRINSGIKLTLNSGATLRIL